MNWHRRIHALRLVISIIREGQALFLMSRNCQHLWRNRQSANNQGIVAQKTRSFELLNFCASRVVTFTECPSRTFSASFRDLAQEAAFSCMKSKISDVPMLERRVLVEIALPQVRKDVYECSQFVEV